MEVDPEVTEDIEHENSYADNEDIEEETKTMEYSEHKWPEEPQEPHGFRFKGKSFFSKATENIKIKLKKGKQKTINNIGVRVLDSRKIPHGTEMDVEAEKGGERGFGVVKIFGPNSKKK